MSKIPDFEGLAMFAKVAEERSFAAAARTMGISVATVSRGVARLEERLGARLFNRTSRRLALTDFGAKLAEKALNIYTAAEEAENAALDLSSTPRGLIRLAVPMSFGLRWIAPILPKFFERYPEIKIDLHLSDAVIDIVGGGFDAALRIAALPDSSLLAKKILPMEAYVVAAPVYLARHGLPRTPSDLLVDHCLGYAYRPRNDVWRFTSTSGEEEVVTPDGPLRVTNVDALVPTLLGGIGIAELPEFIAAEYLADGRLVRVLADWKLPNGALYFVTPSARARPPKIDALADFLVQHLSGQRWV
jgi:DNA-binding transcriptional LysR family regulator